MYLQDWELSLIIAACIDRRVMLNQKSVESSNSRDEAAARAFSTLAHAASKLENKCSLELMRRERGDNRRDGVRPFTSALGRL